VARKRLVKKSPRVPEATRIDAGTLADMMLDSMGTGRYQHGGGEARIRGRVDVTNLPDRTLVRHTTQRGNPKKGNTRAGKRAHRMPYGPGKSW
jgi:hypothetical protein